MVTDAPPDPPNPLLAALLEEIRLSGAMPFSRFQELSLYHPAWGYYTGGRAPGRGGADFVTAPEMDPAFGELVGRQIAEMAGKIREIQSFRVIEYGAGTGRLAASLLDRWQREGSPLYRPGIYCIVEVSPALRALQHETLKEHLEVVSWEGSNSEMPRATPGVILMNEVLDALPVDRVIGASEGLMEIRVGEDRGTLVDVPVPAAEELAAAVQSVLPEGVAEVPEGHEFEICRGLSAFMREAAARITAGYLLIIDYGHTTIERLQPGRKRGTVMAYAGHRATEAILENPGRVDLTAHVDMDMLTAAVSEAGFSDSSCTSQMKFLLALGLGEMMEELESMKLNERQRLSRRLAMASLVRPGGMGEIFKVFIAARKAPMDLLGLQSPWDSIRADG